MSKYSTYLGPVVILNFTSFILGPFFKLIAFTKPYENTGWTVYNRLCYSLYPGPGVIFSGVYLYL
jgi:hypothetical protein